MPCLLRLLPTMVLGALGSCAMFPPNAATSEYLRTTDVGWVISKADKSVHYSLELEAVKPIPAGTVLDASFENADGGAPLSSTQVAGANQTRFEFQSPPITKMSSGRTYMIDVTIFADASRKAVLGKHSQGDYSSFSVPLD